MTVVYTTPHRVASELQTSAFSSSTTPTDEIVEMYIRQVEEEINTITGKSWKITQYSGFINNHNIRVSNQSQIKVYLPHRRLLNFSSTDGDQLKIWDGNSYTDYLANKTEGRANDFYVDYARGVLYFNSTLSYEENSINIIYRYNYGGRTQIDDATNITSGDTTITVDSTSGFPVSGVIRIEDEEIYYTSTSSTTFTGCTRGINDTTAAAHLDNVEITWVPEDISQAATYLVCAKVLKSDDRSVLLPEGTSNVPIQNKEEIYRKRAMEILNNHQQVRLIKNAP